MDADTVERIPLDSQPDHQFRVNARDLHQFLEVGKDFSTWMKDRIEKFQLVEGKDYEVFAELGENPKRGSPALEYSLTVTVSRWVSADVNSERGRQLIKYLVARDDEFTAMQRLDLSDPLTFAKLFIKAEEGSRKLPGDLTVTTKALESERVFTGLNGGGCRAFSEVMMVLEIHGRTSMGTFLQPRPAALPRRNPIRTRRRRAR